MYIPKTVSRELRRNSTTPGAASLPNRPSVIIPEFTPSLPATYVLSRIAFATIASVTAFHT